MLRVVLALLSLLEDESDDVEDSVEDIAELRKNASFGRQQP